MLLGECDIVTSYNWFFSFEPTTSNPSHRPVPDLGMWRAPGVSRCLKKAFIIKTARKQTTARRNLGETGM
jgi:hypothetical protein